MLQRRHSAELLALAAGLGLLAAIAGYLFRQSGIDHSAGAVLVIGSTALLLNTALVLRLAPGLPAPLRWTLWLAAGADVLGTALAAWLLHSWALLALMAVAFVVGTAWAFPTTTETPAARIARGGLAVIMLGACGAAVAAVAIRPAATHAPSAADDGQVWASFNGDLSARKFAHAGQITPENVHGLRRAWEVHTGDVSHGEHGRPASDWGATPLFVNGAVYVSTPFDRVFAVEPDTGRVKWIYDAKVRIAASNQPVTNSRGVAYWQAESPAAGQPCQRRVYLGTVDGRLHALDADTGRLCPDFGRGGVLDINRWNPGPKLWALSLLQPPTVYRDTLLLGWSGTDWKDEHAPPGSVFALDARTGALKWTFQALPRPAWGTTGTANVWASLSVDPKAGLVYLPVSSPSPDFYGGDRKEPLPYADSVTAVDAATGRVVWSRQLVHHDLWDYDVDSAPVLVDIRRDGQVIPALVQSTKQGFLFVLNRLTGEPLFPIEERAAPRSDTPGEKASPTQPYAATPAPVSGDRWPGVSPVADALGLGSCSRMVRRLRYDGRFTPPSLGAGSLIYPGTAGGVEWGGGAVDPASQTYVVNSSSLAMYVQLISRAEYDSQPHAGTKTDVYPMRGGPYAVRQNYFQNRLHMPCSRPPYGELSAYDLQSGRLLWREPFGVAQRYGFYMPASWGSVTIGGPVITRTGLIFIGGSMDSRVRALDLRTGDQLWSGQVDAPAVSIPAVYSYKGREYVVFAAGGSSLMSKRLGDQLVAFALP